MVILMKSHSLVLSEYSYHFLNTVAG